MDAEVDGPAARRPFGDPSGSCADDYLTCDALSILHFKCITNTAWIQRLGVVNVAWANDATTKVRFPGTMTRFTSIAAYPSSIAISGLPEDRSGDYAEHQIQRRSSITWREASPISLGQARHPPMPHRRDKHALHPHKAPKSLAFQPLLYSPSSPSTSCQSAKESPTHESISRRRDGPEPKGYRYYPSRTAQGESAPAFSL